MTYATNHQIENFIHQFATKGPMHQAPTFILDIDGNVACGYNLKEGQSLELQASDDPETQTIPANADIDQLLTDGVIEPAIFAEKTLDVRLPAELVEQINARIAAGDPYSICLLTSRDYSDVEFILRASGVEHPEKVTTVANSGNTLRVKGSKKQFQRALNNHEEAFINGIEEKGKENNQEVRRYLRANGIDVGDDVSLFIENKGAAINLHWRDLCKDIGITEGSDIEQRIASKVNNILEAYLNQENAPKEADGTPVFALGAGPMTREIKLKNVTKAHGVQALTRAMAQEGRHPDMIVFAGDDCVEKPDKPGMYATDYYAMKYVNGLDNGHVVHTHHPVGEDLNGDTPDPKKAAPEDLKIALRTRTPLETASLVTQSVKAMAENRGLTNRITETGQGAVKAIG